MIWLQYAQSHVINTIVACSTGVTLEHDVRSTRFSMSSWRGGLMVSALVSGLIGPGSRTGRGYCVEVFGKTLLSQFLSPPRCMGTGKLNAGGNPAMDSHPFQGGVELLLGATCSSLVGHLVCIDPLPYWILIAGGLIRKI